MIEEQDNYDAPPAPTMRAIRPLPARPTDNKAGPDGQQDRIPTWRLDRVIGGRAAVGPSGCHGGLPAAY